jgi:Holliday junction resolvase RusA-like endonuclease
MIELKGLPFPPTTNHRYIPHMGRLILSPDHRAFKKLLDLYLHRKYMTLDASDLAGAELVVEIDYVGPHSAWYTKSGDIRKIDVDNRHKSLFDGIFPFFDLDDSQVFKTRINKVIDRVAETTVTVRVYMEEVK